MLLLLAGAAGWTAWWFQFERSTRQEMRAWIEARGREGWTVEHAALATAGFPGRLMIHVEKPALGLARDGGSLRWSGQALTVEVAPWNPTEIAFRTTGRQLLDVREGPGTPPYRLQVDSIAGTAALALSTGRWTVDGQGWGLRLSPLDAPATAVTAAAATLRVRLPAGARSTLGAAVDLDTVVLPESGWFGDTFPRILIDADAAWPLPENGTPAAFAAWRDAGGSIAVHRILVEHGPLGIDLSGRLGLDGQLRPAGELDGRVRGYDAALDVLRREGRISANGAATLKLVLGLMAHPAEDGRGSEVPAQLRFRDGRLSLGPVTIAGLEPVAR